MTCQFHQQGNNIHVLIKGSNLQPDNVNVQIQRRRLTVIMKKETLVEGLLHGQVDVGNSRVKVHPDCVEIRLRKANSDETWPQLLLGVPDTTMTSLQRASFHYYPAVAQAQQVQLVSPEHSPVKGKTVVGASVDSLNASLLSLVHKVFTHERDEEMRDDSVNSIEYAV